jgi:hypothetical protein
LFGGLFVVPELDFCSSTDRIATPEAALAFGKDKFRQDKSKWHSLGITSSEELESILNNGICCSAGRGDYFWKIPDHWHVYIAGRSDRKYDFSYEVFLSECKRDFHVEVCAC